MTEASLTESLGALGRWRPVRLAHLIWLQIRARVRSNEVALILIAALVGVIAGAAALGTQQLAHWTQRALYGLAPDDRLSTSPPLRGWHLAIIPMGGLALGAVSWAWARWRARPIIDPVEANALRGGRMSWRDSLFLAFQSVLSNGFGASVGLEAAYAQLGGAAGSVTGTFLNLRRNDMRTFVGAGAGAGIAAAFGAPIAGAFYAFEIVIGSYSAINIAPVVAAALAGAILPRIFQIDVAVIHAEVALSLRVWHYLLFAGLGLASALTAVVIMRAVALVEGLARFAVRAAWLRPAIGGVLLALLAAVDPETLAAGHGAMHFDYDNVWQVTSLATLLVAKAGAAIIALGFGFRGGLFFASLYLGSLLGKLYFLGLYAMGVASGIDPQAGALVGMGALAVAIIGGPFTMSFLVLETTGDFGLTAATLTSSILASVLVRGVFGYSFSTWRLHLRGVNLRGAHDVAWMQTLTAERMMRRDAPTILAAENLARFRERYPLGSIRRLLAVDEEGRYVGVVSVARAHADPDAQGVVGRYATGRAHWLRPDMQIREIMRRFDQAETEELPVLDPEGHIMGLVSESYAARRYAEELEKSRADLIGVDARHEGA